MSLVYELDSNPFKMIIRWLGIELWMRLSLCLHNELTCDTGRRQWCVLRIMEATGATRKTIEYWVWHLNTWVFPKIMVLPNNQF